MTTDPARRTSHHTPSHAWLCTDGDEIVHLANARAVVIGTETDMRFNRDGPSVGKLSTVQLLPLQIQAIEYYTEGLKHDSSIHCDGLVSLEKSRLTDYVGVLSPSKLAVLDIVLGIALDLPASRLKSH